MGMFEGGPPGKNWYRRIKRIIDLVDTPAQYGTPGQGLVLDATGRKLAWLTLTELYLRLDRIVLYADPAVIYDTDDTGMAAAIAAASSGDTIWIPPSTYASNYTIPAGVTVHGESRADVVFSGQIMLSSESILESVSIIRVLNDANVIYGLLAPVIGKAYVVDCSISVTQNGSGAGIGILVHGRGRLGAGRRDPGLINSRVYGNTQDIT